MSYSFTKLFSSLTTSTIWCEDSNTRVVWITMLSVADRQGRVFASIPGLAGVARVPVDDARRAIAKFLEPDPDSRTPDYDGRRIEVIEGGWRLLNYAKYREMRDRETVLESKRRYIRERRAAERAAREGDDAEQDVEQCRKSRSPSIQAEAEAEAEAINTVPTVLVKRCASDVSQSSEEEATKKPGYQVPDCPYQRLVDAYHEHLPMLPRVVVLSDQRKALMRARWRQVCAEEKFSVDEGVDWFAYYWRLVAASPFLTGKTKQWRASFDWLLKATNFVKVYEGHYERK